MIQQFFCLFFIICYRGNLHHVVTGVQDCDIVVCGFEPKLHYHIHFRANTFEKNGNSLISFGVG